jgi:hypothetical protein
MSIWSDPVGFRRTVAGGATIAAGVFTFAGMLADPRAADDGHRAYLASLVANPGSVQVSTALLWVGYVSTVVMMLAMVHLVRDRGVVLAHVGALIAIPAGMTVTGVLIIDTIELGITRQLGLEAALALDESGELLPVLILFIAQAPLLLLGFILLQIALWRSGFVPGIYPVVVLTAQAAFVLGATTWPVGPIATGVLALAYGWLGVRILRLDDASWLAGGQVAPGEVDRVAGEAQAA